MSIGQILGILASIIGVCSFQVNTKRNLLLIQTISAACTCLSYFFLGAFSGFALNIVSLTRNAVFYFIKENTKSNYILTAIFMIIMGVVGILSWQGIISLLIIIALIANTFFVCLGNPQRLRYSILVTSTMVLIYNIFFFAIGGILYEGLAIISSVIGIFRFCKEKSSIKNKE